jgi:hypothetical protein
MAVLALFPKELLYDRGFGFIERDLDPITRLLQAYRKRVLGTGF